MKTTWFNPDQLPAVHENSCSEDVVVETDDGQTLGHYDFLAKEWYIQGLTSRHF